MLTTLALYSYITLFLDFGWLLLVTDMITLLKQSGPPPVLVKAEVPWSAKRGTLSEKDQVLKTVKGYCFLVIMMSVCLCFCGYLLYLVD